MCTCETEYQSHSKHGTMEIYKKKQMNAEKDTRLFDDGKEDDLGDVREQADKEHDNVLRDERGAVLEDVSGGEERTGEK